MVPLLALYQGLNLMVHVSFGLLQAAEFGPSKLQSFLMHAQHELGFFYGLVTQAQGWPDPIGPIQSLKRKNPNNCYLLVSHGF